MCAAIVHRGPDGDGYYVNTGTDSVSAGRIPPSSIGLGMRRLAVVDLVTGQQPIHNEDRTVWVVFNGEIYNYRELREELERRGHRFYTKSDTETIVHAYEEWGLDAFVRLRGMFGIAVWDTRDRSLVLARDRVGIKPLYYAETADRLYFGSEVKSVLAAGDVPTSVDPAALDHYLSFLYTPADRSIFTGVRKLPPGHLLRWKDGRSVTRQYWELPADERSDMPEAEAVEQLRHVLQDAVTSHLMSEVPLGAFLSGGV